MAIDRLREGDAGAPPVDPQDFTLSSDPWALFAAWMAEAEASEPCDANAMALATAGPDGLPDVRVVLLKGLDPRGLVFYTNAESAKGQQLMANPQAATVLYWKSLGRQIRARGPVSPVAREEADAYFASRHRDSRIGAIASQQSRPLTDRPTLMAEVAALSEKYENGPVPRPEHWLGFRIAPVQLEFWQNGAYRLHDRVRFTRAGDGWTRARLYP
ncbi:pyridoxamine 5'-phosphate oxidase [Methylorubrum populi]|jgi:pyridoxamine 5'-phosphate oxidase|uniref:Pyridoxine/pyridoxamine 5'-phosphate oxidase n=1 Tax=Methylorubrum populi (strain ATCC BAA-705 / NCIMB 13946 / BJ001) TaxID=441620 RepID=B1ZJZ5_METPB|nr:pyridoxamine 5'-phosphate oxidase [Methylorubrum populi]ACB82909.1 pyridoxamine 5'-phosphate oxidase [Methylorubrum populi BJ001]OAH26769.1 pyridoxamine 5'-phosphate oxidase [Methylorubrum populi]PZP68876.1 MAG: pyridoxamine 5'-phosphate oxidase [Methylorubrum populi]